MAPAATTTEHPPVDVCIAGAGAAGGLLFRLLAEAGLRTALLEAGPWYDDPRLHIDEHELRMRKTWWPESQYTLTGTAQRGRVNTGYGVGGGTLVWTGAAFRLFESDFRVLGDHGAVAEANLADWPLSYADLEPAYDAVEAHIGLAGTILPWDPPGRRPPPQPPHGYHRHTVVLREGFTRLGLRTAPGPMAILSQPAARREACCACGFCIQGCRTGAMYSTAVAEVPHALATGRAELRAESVALRVLTSSDGTRAEAVEYGTRAENSRHVQPAKVIVVANNVIETPRLLLNSASAKHPQGLANSSGQLGRNFMSHPGVYCWGVFGQDMKPWEGFVLNHLCCLDLAQTRPGQPYIRGFAMETLTGLPVGISTGLPAELWGVEHKALMRR
ncbi:MAG TPA: GMC family oxidoreductase N-terminal domain-containing protein, partial [Chloroflexota bacterium]